MTDQKRAEEAAEAYGEKNGSGTQEFYAGRLAKALTEAVLFGVRWRDEHPSSRTTLAEQDRDSWKSSYLLQQNAANEHIKDLEAEAIRLKADMAASQAREERLAKALKECERFLAGGVMRRHELVRQLDGTTKSELIRTYHGEFYDKLALLLADHAKAKPAGGGGGEK